MITCLILEDEPLAMQLMAEYISKHSMLELKAQFHNPLEAITWLQQYSVDIIFLDIQLPGMTGMEFAKLLPKHQRIIFTTAYIDYALDSFSFHVIDYLLKPISFERFSQATQKLVERMQQPASNLYVTKNDTANYLPIKMGQSLMKIQYEEIQFIKAQKEYIQIHTQEQRYLLYKRMKDLAVTLPSSFIRIHHSFIINLNYLQKTGAHYVQIGEAILPISASYKQALQKKLHQHLL